MNLHNYSTTFPPRPHASILSPSIPVPLPWYTSESWRKPEELYLPQCLNPHFFGLADMYCFKIHLPLNATIISSTLCCSDPLTDWKFVLRFSIHGLPSLILSHPLSLSLPLSPSPSRILTLSHSLFHSLCLSLSLSLYHSLSHSLSPSPLIPLSHTHSLCYSCYLLLMSTNFTCQYFRSISNLNQLTTNCKYIQHLHPHYFVWLTSITSRSYSCACSCSCSCSVSNFHDSYVL